MTDDTIDGRDAQGLLGDFGLSGQEAAVYLALLGEGELNGYEAAKLLAISRSNAYTALAGLVEKGAAWTVEGTPLRYAAVPAEEFSSNRLRALASARERLLLQLPKRRESPGSYITIRGRERILDRLRHLLGGVEERVYLALEGRTLDLYADELADLAAAGRKVVIITDTPRGDAASDDAASGGADSNGSKVYSGPIAAGQIRAIADSRYVLTGELGGDGREATALFSDHPNLVELFKTSLRNEIRLIELGEACTEE